jgi:hypothetical protein
MFLSSLYTRKPEDGALEAGCWIKCRRKPGRADVYG